MEVPQETRPERRTKLSVIEVVGGTILGLIAGVLTFYLIFVGSAVFLIQIAGKLTIADTLKWSVTIVLISVSVVAGVFVYGRTYRRFTRRKHSNAPERYDGTNR